jgi:hypothetical protein
MVVIDAEHGPVYVDEEAVIHPFSRIEGPCYIGKKSLLLGANCLPGRRQNLLAVGYARATKFLNDQGHALSQKELHEAPSLGKTDPRVEGRGFVVRGGGIAIDTRAGHGKRDESMAMRFGPNGRGMIR